MWVIYDTDTGVEWNRIEDYDEACALVKKLNDFDEYDHYTKRWED